MDWESTNSGKIPISRVYVKCDEEVILNIFKRGGHIFDDAIILI